MPIFVLLDSNFFMLPIMFKIDIFKEIEDLISRETIFVTVPPVLNELRRLSEKPTKLGRKALLALYLASKCEILETDMENLPKGRVDDFILEFSKRKKFIVATTDINLKKRLREMNVPVIYLRGRSHIELDGFID